MVIYTPVPLELLVSSTDKQKFAEMQFGEAKLIIETAEDGSSKIHRVISTNPQDYLNPLLQPGSEVKYIPEISGRRC